MAKASTPADTAHTAIHKRQWLPIQLASTAFGYLRAAYATGAFHLLLSIVFIQGLAYISQLTIARFTTPSEFGVVRSVEALISTMLIIGSAGMPSLAIKSIAETSDRVERSIILGRLVKLAAAMGLISALGAVVLSDVLFPELHPYVAVLAWLMAITACSRTCINYFQGIRQFQRVAVINSLLSIVAIAILTSLVIGAGLTGWLIGRYVGEALFLVGSFWLVRHAFRWRGTLAAKYGYRALLTMGLAISLSLLVRTIIDNSALFAISYFNVSSIETGYFGLASLLANVLMVIPATIAGIALPKLVECSRRPTAQRSLYYKLLKITALITICSASACILLSPIVIPIIFGQEYAPTARIVQILGLAVPLRGVATIAGAFLLAMSEVKIAFRINLFALFIGIILYFLAIPHWGIQGAAVTVVVIELVSFALFVIAIQSILNK